MLTLAQVKRIRLETRRRRRDPDLIQNNDLHRRILKAWEQDSPTMWASLQAAGVANDAAFLAQQRMWEEQARLMKAGMPVTDAREEAEKAHLLLTPEALPAEPETGQETADPLPA